MSTTATSDAYYIVNREYFGIPVRAICAIDNGGHPYPWRFVITHPERGEIYFGGIPNACDTAASALKRAWWRCKWINDGTYDERYR